MFLWYRGIPAQILQTNDVSREPVYTEDGQDMIYQKWTIDVLMQINPSTMSYVSDYPNAPRISYGTQVATSDHQLRQHFMTPSGRLALLTMAPGGTTDTLLDIPIPPYTCDARGGPYPKHFDIIKVHSDKTLTIRYIIEAYNQNEYYILPGGNPSAIIAHRWRQWMDVDEDHFAVRITQGTAHFDLSQLAFDERSPDQFRQDMAFPIPVGWKRENIRVEQSMDGTAIHYSFEERELPINYGPNMKAGVTRCEAYLTERTHYPGITQALWDAGVTGVKDIVDVLSGLVSTTPTKAIGKAVNDIIDNGQGILPTKYRNVLVRVWGNKNSLKRDLLDFAMGIAASRALDVGPSQNIPTEDITVRWEMTGKFIEVDWTWIFGQNGLTAMGAYTDSENLTGDDDVRAFYTGKTYLQNAASVAPVPPNSNGTRGTSIVGLVAQALTAPGQLPVSPHNSDNIDRNFYPEWQQQLPIKSAYYPPQSGPPANQQLLPIFGGDIAYPPGPPAGTTPDVTPGGLKAEKPWNPDPRQSTTTSGGDF